MISLALARALKEAGLPWQPQLHDFFGIPERGLEDGTFVISNMPAVIESLFGAAVVAFQGSSEWALDYLLTTEAVWMPTEEQLRTLIEKATASGGDFQVSLVGRAGSYRCEFNLRGQSISYDGSDAATAYGRALLYLLDQKALPDLQD